MAIAVDILLAHRLRFLLGHRALAEPQELAAHRADRRLGLQLGRIAHGRVVEAGEPDPDRPLALGLGFLGRVVEFARHALGGDVAYQHVALRARYAARCSALGAYLA